MRSLCSASPSPPRPVSRSPTMLSPLSAFALSLLFLFVILVPTTDAERPPTYEQLQKKYKCAKQDTELPNDMKGVVRVLDTAELLIEPLNIEVEKGGLDSITKKWFAMLTRLEKVDFTVQFKEGNCRLEEKIDIKPASCEKRGNTVYCTSVAKPIPGLDKFYFLNITFWKYKLYNQAPCQWTAKFANDYHLLLGNDAENAMPINECLYYEPPLNPAICIGTLPFVVVVALFGMLLILFIVLCFCSCQAGKKRIGTWQTTAFTQMRLDTRPIDGSTYVGGKISKGTGMTGLTTKDRFRTGAYTTDWATKDTTKAGAFTTDWTTKDRTKAGAFKTKDKTKAFSRY